MYFLQDALDSPLIENDYASVNDALPEGQLQRIKSTQRKAKDKNKLKTGIQCSLGLAPPFYRQPHLSPKFSSVPISPIKNTPLYCQTQLPPSATGFQTQKS